MLHSPSIDGLSGWNYAFTIRNNFIPVLSGTPLPLCTVSCILWDNLQDMDPCGIGFLILWQLWNI